MDRFVTKTFEHGLALELRLPGLEMQFQERGEPVPHVLDPEERSPAEVEAWILVELLHRGLDRDKFIKSLPYTIANLMSGDAEDYSPQACAAGLAQLTAWFRAASAVLSTHGRVVCLPQTLTLEVASGRGTPAVGFSPGSAERDEPHFFTGTYDDGQAPGARGHQNWRTRKIQRPLRPNSSKRRLTSCALEFLCGDFRFEVNLIACKAACRSLPDLLSLLHDRNERIGHRQNDLSFRPKQSNVLTDDRLNQWKCACSVM